MNRHDLLLRTAALAGAPGFPSSSSASALANLNPLSLLGSGGLNLTTFYGVSPSRSASQNAAAIQKAFADSGGFTALYLPAGRYPCDPILLPNTPITWTGDGKDLSVLVFPPSVPTASATTTAARVAFRPAAPGSRRRRAARTRTTPGRFAVLVSRAATERLRGQRGPVFPNWSPSGGHDAMALRMFYVGVYLFNGPGIVYEISGLVGDSEFVDVDVASCSGVGLIPGSDQRWINMLAHDCGSWGVKPNTHRNTQLLGGKAYGNGQIDDAGGYFMSGNENTSQPTSTRRTTPGPASGSTARRSCRGASSSPIGTVSAASISPG